MKVMMDAVKRPSTRLETFCTTSRSHCPEFDLSVSLKKGFYCVLFTYFAHFHVPRGSDHDEQCLKVWIKRNTPGLRAIKSNLGLW